MSNPESPEEPYYAWIIDKKQCDHLSELLETDFKQFNIGFTKVLCPETRCAKCGKISAFDDIVAGALKLNVHSREFMKGDLMNPRPEHLTPPIKLDCSNCGDTFLKCNYVTGKPTEHAGLVSRAISYISASPTDTDPRTCVQWPNPTWQGRLPRGYVETEYLDPLPPGWSPGAYTPFMKKGIQELLLLWAPGAISWSKDRLKSALEEVNRPYDDSKFRAGTPEWQDQVPLGTPMHWPDLKELLQTNAGEGEALELPWQEREEKKESL